MHINDAKKVSTWQCITESYLVFRTKADSPNRIIPDKL